MKIFDTIIIGSGIAGITSAIYASRKNMEFALISEDLGGQILVSDEILNYPGFDNIKGIDFYEKMKNQIEFNKIKIIFDKVIQTRESKKNIFQINTIGKKKFYSKTIIIATGASAKKLNVKGEEKFLNKGLTYCSICDGPLFKNKTVTIIGGGNSALEAAYFMKDIAKKINLITIEKRLAGHEYLIENVKKMKNIAIHYNAKTLEIIGDNTLKGLKILQKNKIKNLNCDGVIIEIGRIPSTEIFKNFVKLDEHNHIIIDCQCQTSRKGVFACGDCASGHEYQYVIAAGQGCMALIKAAKYLSKKK